MKRILIFGLFIAISMSISLPTLADDIDAPATGDLWDNWNTRQDEREAKPVSDEEFDKALKQVDQKVNK